MPRYIALALFPLAIALASDQVNEDFRYNYPLAPGGRLAIENFNGSVEIIGSDRNDVEITGTKHAETRDKLGQIRIDVQASGSAIRIRTVGPDDRNQRGNMGARYVLRVPRRVELEDIVSSNGPVRIEDIDGGAKVRTSNGPVRALRVRGDVEVKTSNGPVEAEQVGGTLDAKTSNGPIRAHIGSGNKPITLITSNGPVELTMDAAASSDVRATTSNGGITLRMPPTAGARIKAATSSHSRVTSDFDMMTRGGEMSRGNLEATIGGGGPLFELTTSNGGIRLLKK